MDPPDWRHPPPQAYGTHSLRRTKAPLIYRRTKNLRAVQLLLGQRRIKSTIRYLRIKVDDALQMAEQVLIRLPSQRLLRKRALIDPERPIPAHLWVTA